jgi:hypothetical protein
MPSQFSSETAGAQSAVRTLRRTLMLACEDADQFQQILDEYMAAYEPKNPIERDLVEDMFAATWRIRRIKMIETALINHEMNLPDIHLAAALRALADPSRTLSLITRYESNLNRFHRRSHQTLLEFRRSVT